MRWMVRRGDGRWYAGRGWVFPPGWPACFLNGRGPSPRREASWARDPLQALRYTTRGAATRVVGRLGAPLGAKVLPAPRGV